MLKVPEKEESEQVKYFWNNLMFVVDSRSERGRSPIFKSAVKSLREASANGNKINRFTHVY
jgi:hypothetical protein